MILDKIVVPFPFLRDTFLTHTLACGDPLVAYRHGDPRVAVPYILTVLDRFSSWKLIW